VKQLDIFDEYAYAEQGAIKTLTPRQWALYRALKATNGRKMSDKELLIALPDYGYNDETAQNPNREWNNLSCVRNLRFDKQAIRKNATIQKIITNGKLATTTDEALKYLRKKKIKALKILKEYYTEMAKLNLDGQLRLQFGRERERIEAILRVEEE